jgi:hypothetical protein
MSEAEPAEEPIVPRPDPAERFHAHLDECPRCANEPFNLCPVGNILLLATATGPR